MKSGKPRLWSRRKFTCYVVLLAMLFSMVGIPNPALVYADSGTGSSQTVASTVYAVTVDNSISGGTVTVEPASGPAGEIITVTVTADSGKRLVAGSLQYTADDGENYTEITAAAGVYSFLMPEANVTVRAQFEDIPAVTYTVTVDGSITGGTVAVSPASAAVGQTITVTVAPDSGKRLVAGSLQYTADDGENYTEITAAEGVYSFVLPAANVTLTAQFEDEPAAPSVWDGSIDVTWYNTTDTVFYINTPAKLAGLAAIVNGIYNEGATVIGNPEYIVYKVGGGDEADATTNTWIYGDDDFTGKTVYLTADLDMGGVYDSSTDTWSGPNYMPVGGQYCMTKHDATTLLSSSWNGTFDGQGHTVKNIYCDRYSNADISNPFMLSQSIGLIGRLGVHDSDPTTWYTTPSVKNVAVTGYIYGRRSVGGIVGKSGRSNGSVIENCINYASVSNTDSKGVGGIAGAGWNNLTIKNCANLGNIYTSYSNAGGISGSCEAFVYNSYNVGYVGASSANQAQAMGTSNNNLAVWTNCYWLTGSCASGQAVYGSPRSGFTNTITEISETDSMKTADFLAALNGDGRAWVADTQNINSGYPVPRAWTTDTATVTSTSKEADPVKISYIAGETFDPTGLVIWANYSDDTREKIADYTISKTAPLETTDTSITVSGTIGGTPYSYDFTITVEANELASIAITTQPANVLYAAGETFNPTGMVVRATYSNNTTVNLTAEQYTISPSVLTPADTKVTVSYTEGDITKTVDQTVTVLATGPPALSGDVYELSTADHMRWFANQVNTNINTAVKGKLMNDIDLSAVNWKPIGNSGSRRYAGTFDGDGKTVTLAINTPSTSYSGLFGYVQDGTVRDLTVAGSVSGNQYSAGLVGYANGATVIENCVNNAGVTGASYYTGGIVAYATDTATVSGCTNNGTVTSTSYNVGGVAGNVANAGVTVTRSGNTAAITGSSYNVGGILGNSGSYAHTLSLCYNTGAVSGTHSVGGILGSGRAVVSDCYNTGAVSASAGTANQGAGGIAGTYNTSAITNCYSTGAVTPGSGPAGAVVGRLSSGSIVNCYYLAGAATLGVGSGTNETTAKTETELKSAALAELLGEAYLAQSDAYPILAWQGTTAPETYTVTVDGSISGGTVAVDPTSGTEGTVVTVTATPDAGKRLAAGSLQYNDGAADIEITATEGVYSFLMPAANVTVTAQFEDEPGVSPVWDGSIDVSWYNTTDTVFHLSSPAQLAGLAAIVNGLVPSDAAIIGNPAYIQATGAESSLTGTVSAITYRGMDDFKGRTIRLTADLDMGGVYDSGTGLWSGPNYMPIGGQYMIDTTDTDTLLNAPFNGTFDGQGHTVKNIYCDRYTTEGFEWSQSVGLIGRLGVHDNDAAALRADNPTVRNVVVSGYIYARRSVGGVVGKIGKTNNGGIIENCANFVTVRGTDSKGTGGIVGAGWNGGYIKNCYNAGNVINSYPDGTGGISGANEVNIYNCYNVGTITGSASSAFAIGHNNGFTHTISNSYWLTGSAPGGGYSSSGPTFEVIEKTSAEMKTPEFLTALNGDGRAFVADTNNINNGYPILRVQVGDSATLTSITQETAPTKLSYVAGQTFDAAGLGIWANYSDGTKEKITNYTISKTTALETTDTTITVSGVYGGMPYIYDFTITVIANALASIAITTPPANVLYAAGESFNPAGMVVRATYTNDTTEILTADEYTFSPEAGTPLTPADTQITVSYTEGGVTKTADQPITVLASAPPALNGDVYELSTSDHLLWFANQVNSGSNNAISGKLMNNIDLSEVTWTPIGTSNSSRKYTGTFDGGGHQITLVLNGGSVVNQGLFGYAAGATIKDLTVSGSVTTTGNYAAGLVARADGVTVENCVNKAAISGNQYVAGLLGYSITNATTVTDCTNEGAITATGNFAGGILGSINAAATIADCVNKGTVSGAQSIGGVVGNVANAGVTVTRSGNTAAITGTANNVGGIVGNSGSYAHTLSLCYNTGAVSGTHSVGGILGSGRAVVSDCYNTGAVSASAGTVNQGAGGIAGTYTNSSITNCYSTGAVTPGSGPAGAVVGRLSSGSTVNCYYLEGAAALGVGNGTDATTSKTEAEMKSGALAELLGAAYLAQDSAYPILAWQGAAAPETYSVTVDGSISGGTVVVSPASAAAGETVTVTVTPDEGKRLVAGSLQYNDGAGDTEITATDGVYSFLMPAADVTVTAQFEDLSPAPQYTVTPVEDEAVYEVGETGGIKTMTVKTGVSGLKYFGTLITPVVEHEGEEAVVFTHLRDGIQLSLNVTKTDFDLVDEAQAGFNVQAGDVVKVYIVDDLTNDLDFNPTPLQ